jgi:hypothetical protein
MCNNSTGLVTNGSGGYLNSGGNNRAGMMQSTGFISTGSFPQEGLPPTASVAALSPFVSNPVSVSDITSASNSFTDGTGTPVYANPGLPPVTEELCNAIKCGANTTADTMTKFACSLSYGAGNWDTCLPQNTATPTPLAVQFPNQPLTPQSLTAPVPDITGGQNWGVAPAVPQNTCGTSWISDNPLLAVGALAALFILAGGMK